MNGWRALILILLASPSAALTPVDAPLPGNLVEVPVAAPGEVFVPPALVDIPEDKQGDLVKQGRLIFIDTVNHARRYAGNQLACASCHLSEGRKPNAAPMWAAWGRYPRMGDKPDVIQTFESKVQDCFHFSLNGQSPPLDSPEMLALVAYAQWLASDAPTGADMPGQGLGAPEALAGAVDTHVALAGSASRGETLYRAQCLTCHGPDGQGVARRGGGHQFPPLWGKASYSAGSALARPAPLAAYLQANMPLGRGSSLTAQQAADLAAYLLIQPRPADPRLGLLQRWRATR
ncbi:MAG: c-type cytochrome [Thiobacillus sp.]